MNGTGPRRRTSVFAASTSCVAVLTTPLLCFGAPAAKAAPSSEPALPTAQTTLKVTPGSEGGHWRLSIENAGDGPVRIPADPRLLILELTPPVSSTPSEGPSRNKKAKTPPTTPRCILPDDARPSTDEGRELVLLPKRSWSVTFDPLFYCFSERERAALVPGTTVKARFGWPSAPTRAGATPGRTPALAPPFAITPVGVSVGKLAPTKVIEADEFALSEAAGVAKPGGSDDESASTTVELSVPEAMDAARGTELATTVTLVNHGDRPVTLLYRPDMLQFNVSGPAGSISCGQRRGVAAPIRELFTAVPVNGKTSMTVLVTATCPAGTFDEPGIYRLTPRLDTTEASGRSIGLKSWDGVAVGKAPLLLRVRSPRTPALPPRPTPD